MILLGSVEWDGKNEPLIPITFEYDKRRSGADMQYQIKITISPITGTKYFGYPIYFGWSINGVDVSSVTLKTSWPSRWEDAITYTTPWYTVANKTTGTTGVSLHVYSGQGSSRSSYYSYSMGVDPAASEISASNGTLGTPLTINVTRYNSAFKDTITYTCGTATGTVCTGSTSTSVTWDAENGNTEDLSSQNTTGESLKVTFTIYTYSGSTLVGTNSAVITCTIPDSVKPSVSLSVSDWTGIYNDYDAFVQGYSQLHIVATPKLAHGSPIKSYTITADGKTYNSTPVTTDVIQGSGTMRVTAVVTDNREHTSDPFNKDIEVLEYKKPIVTVTAYRCNSSGVADAEGAYMKVGFTATISDLKGKNNADYEITYSGGSSPISGSGTSFESEVIECNIASVCKVEVAVSDRISRTKASSVIPIAFTLTDYYRTGKGIAFGKVGTRDGFDCAMDAYFSGKITVNDKLLVDLIYPVGSIYISTNNVSPQAFFGGTWDRIKDVFLLSAGDTYTAGRTGGESTHTLTTDEMPTHYHDGITADEYLNSHRMLYDNQAAVGSGNSAYWSITSGTTPTARTARTVDAGGGKAHNNMPPYLTVYMWKRTK